MTVKSMALDVTPSSASTALVHPVVDLVAQRAAGDGERDLHRDVAVDDRDVADHAEIDDAAVQLGILDRPQGLDDLFGGDWHGRSALLCGSRWPGAGDHGPARPCPARICTTGTVQTRSRLDYRGRSPTPRPAAGGFAEREAPAMPHTTTADTRLADAPSPRPSRPASPPPSSPRWSPRSPPPSATRPDATSTSTPTRSPRASPRRRRPPASTCTPTWPATTSTSSPAAATSRSSRRRAAGPVGRRRSTAAPNPDHRRGPRPPSRCAGHAAGPGAGDAQRGAGRGDGRRGRRRVRPGDGRGHGRRRRRPIVPPSLHTVADALTANGFAAHAEKYGDELQIVAENCPFGGAAIEHPVICAVDRGMVKGMLDSLHGSGRPATSSSRARRRRLRHRSRFLTAPPSRRPRQRRQPFGVPSGPGGTVHRR